MPIVNYYYNRKSTEQFTYTPMVSIVSANKNRKKKKKSVTVI